MKLNELTPVVLTFNEAANIGRALAKLLWAKDIVVVDSFSTDGTLEIISKFSNARVFQRKFDSHAVQANYAISETGIKTEWILSLDADYVLMDEFVEELEDLSPHPDPLPHAGEGRGKAETGPLFEEQGKPFSISPRPRQGERAGVRGKEICAYQARFIYCISGKRLRGTLYPPRIVLFKKGKGKYIQDGHAHRFQPEGSVREIKSFILHDDRKPFPAWFAAQKRYTALEAEKLRVEPFLKLSWPDRIRKLMIIAPFAVPVYCLFIKGLVLDGWPGIYYSLQRALAELLLSLNLFKMAGRPQGTGNNPLPVP